jgi:hypothetical protein
MSLVVIIIIRGFRLNQPYSIQRRMYPIYAYPVLQKSETLYMLRNNKKRKDI